MGLAGANAVPLVPSRRAVDAEGTTEPGPGPASGVRWAFGVTLGRYVILETLDRAGVGSTVRAYDPKLQREVVLKRVRDSGDAPADPFTIFRALARIADPHVLAVYDVDSLDEGVAVLAMEYVPGQTLEAWLAQGRREVTQILQYFCAAGRGLVAAHRADLIHGAFTAAKVRIGRDGGIKVTDFGQVAVDHEPGAGPAHAFAADQYAFCQALLRALGSGDTSAPVAVASPMGRASPVWPKHLPRIPSRIRRALVRGLDPDPAHRWAHMAELVAELSRGFAGKHRRTVLLAAVVGVGLAAVGPGHAWVQARADRCSGAEPHMSQVWDPQRRERVHAAMLQVPAPYAAAAAETAMSTIDTYTQGWAAAYQEACEATSIRHEASAADMDLKMSCLQRAKQDLAATIGVLSTADATVVQHAHDILAALPSLAACGDAEALTAEVAPPDPAEAEHVAAVRGALAEANAEERAGRYDGAWSRWGAAAKLAQGLRYGPIQTELAVREGFVLEQLGRYDEAIAALGRGIRLAGQHHQISSLPAAVNKWIFVLAERQRRWQEARALLPLAEGASRGDRKAELRAARTAALLRDVEGDVQGAQTAMAAVVAGLRELGQSEELELARTQHSLANLLYHGGQYIPAEAELRACIPVFERVLGPSHPDLAMVLNSLAVVRSAQGDVVQAIAILRRVLRLQTDGLDRTHPSTLATQNNLAVMLAMDGQAELAEAEFRAVLAARIERLGPDHLDVAGARNNLAHALALQQRWGAAAREYERALAGMARAVGPDHREVAGMWLELAAVRREQGDLAGAAEAYRRRLAIDVRAPEGSTAATDHVRAELAQVLSDMGQSDRGSAGRERRRAQP